MKFILFVLVIFTFTIGCREDILVTPDSQFSALEPGSFTVSSRPQGAEILLNNKIVNRFTPSEFTNITPGNYSVTLIREGFADTTVIFNVESGKNKIISVSLEFVNWNKGTLKKIIIAATAQNGVIGNSGKIPWHSSTEFKHFKQTTIGFPIIMGRKTFESIRKPLPGRLSIIISRNPELSYEFENVVVFTSLEKAIHYCETEKYEKVFIIGGGEIYKQSLKFVDELIISIMKLEVEGDTFFPKIDKNIWEVTDKKEFDEFTVCYYSRIWIYLISFKL